MTDGPDGTDGTGGPDRTGGSAGTDAADGSAGTDEPEEVDADGRGRETAAETEPVEREPPRLEDLSLPQRVFVAAVQNPTRGLFVLFLFAFAFSFYVALWMAFPRVAGIGTLVVGVAGVLIGMLLHLLR